jgi:tRNA 2-selenouridine synthase
MHREIEVEDALKLSSAGFVDVRSPLEYELDTFPGAVNIPLFDNEQRQRIGTTYAADGPHEARKLGLRFIAPRLPEYIEQLAAVKGEPLVIFCWRGGERSKTVAGLLDMMHMPCLRLKGGYKAYRQYVNKVLHESKLPHQFVVLEGLTGTGKTEIIQELGRKGYPILDLEALANHRGSVFGAVGLGEQPSQKKFESLIWASIRNFDESNNFLIVEGESKKIGRLYLPDAVYNGMQEGYRILVYDTVSRRVNRLIKEYVNTGENNLSQVGEALSYLTRRLGKEKVRQLRELLAAKDLEQFGRILIEDYYDVLYGRNFNAPEQYDLLVDAGNLQGAVKQIEEFIQHLF